nr:hypothetical protein [Helicobacter trogontum]
MRSKLLSAICSISMMFGFANTLQAKETWDKVFKPSNKVEIQKVSFTNRYGITLVGDLYIPNK